MTCIRFHIIFMDTERQKVNANCRRTTVLQVAFKVVLVYSEISNCVCDGNYFGMLRLTTVLFKDKDLPLS